jgi:hypothetical protein
VTQHQCCSHPLCLVTMAHSSIQNIFLLPSPALPLCSYCNPRITPPSPLHWRNCWLIVDFILPPSAFIPTPPHSHSFTASRPIQVQISSMDTLNALKQSIPLTLEMLGWDKSGSVRPTRASLPSFFPFGTTKRIRSAYDSGPTPIFLSSDSVVVVGRGTWDGE